MSDNFQIHVVEQLGKLTEAVQHIAQGQEKILVRLDNVEQKVTILDAKVSSLDVKVSSLDAKVNSLDAKVSSLDGRVERLEKRVEKVEVSVNSLHQRVDALIENVSRVHDTVSRIEHDHGQKIGVLFDAFSLRGDHLQDLKDHFDRRFDTAQAATNFLLARSNEHEFEINRLRKAK